MNRTLLKRVVSLAIVLILSVSTALAQNSGDSYYNKGLQQQKTMTVKAQNDAIANFRKAKAMYDSKAKKSMCDQAISVSQNIISNINKGGGGSRGSSTKTTVIEKVKEVDPTLELDNTEFNLDRLPKTVVVNVSTNQDSWTVAPVSCDDGSSFITVNRLGNSGFEIKVAQNDLTLIREQKVRVSTGDLYREVTLRQTGRPIKMEISKKVLKFKEKGGDQKTDVMCNSDYAYDVNGNRNWYVESKPDWIEVTVNEKKEGGLKGLLNKGKQLINGTSESDSDASMQKFNITLTASHLIPGRPEAHTGRKGEVVFRSGDERITVHVSQVGKDGLLK